MLSIVLTLSLIVGGDARWLQLCDKGPGSPAIGTLAWEDAPVREDLLDSLRRRGWTLRHVYKWENKVSAISDNPTSLPPCVHDAGPVATTNPRRPPPLARSQQHAGVDEYTVALKAIWDTMGIEPVRAWLWSRLQAPGEGVTVAIIDGRFARDHKAFAGMSIKDTFDFVQNHDDPWDRNASDWSDLHGTSIASLIGSSWDGIPGIAPKADFLLYRAEDADIESTQEEDHLAAALVRAVEHGAEVISSSLGYRFLDNNNTISMHDWKDYDGRTLVASRAATAAARRGAIVVVSAGNEGALGAQSIGSPADADSILTVGALDHQLNACNWGWRSSWGPTADGRQKPDVSAFGCSVPVATGPTPTSRTETQGSSVAAPLVAGLAVLATQTLRGKLSSGQIRDRIQRSGHLWPRIDTSMGSGLPDLRRIEEIRSLIQSGGGLNPSSRPGLTWRQGSLRFTASSAILGSTLGVEVTDPQGHVLFSRKSTWNGEVLWKPQTGGSHRPGILLARWWGDYGKGSTRLMLLP
ncbi:MAG TPA: S8 family serine peptidase [Fibrobacteria bacterium]|nr:S8 family serine peptidase [Fibrobacteria bacterium]HOX51755.1 S8 family serine peptidase [Fibrobacteria bacterium]